MPLAGRIGRRRGRRRRRRLAAPAARTGVAVLVGAASLAGLAAPAGAQQWSLEARGGRLDFELDGAVPAATSLGFSLARETADSWLQLSTGVPLGEEDPLWGAANVGGRAHLIEEDAVRVALDLGGQGFLQRYGQQLRDGPGGPFDRLVEDEGTTWGHGLAFQGLPVVAAVLGRVTVQARAGVSWYRSALGEVSRQRTVPMADVRLALRAAPGFSLAGDARHYAAPEGEFTFGGVTAMLARPELRLWGSVGRWFADSAEAVPWSAGAAVPLAERLEITVEAREDALDPLYGSTPRRSWSAGLRLVLSDPPDAAAPVPAGYEGGRAVIAIPVSDAEGGAGGAPRIAGDFTGWEPRPMTRAGSEWRYAVALEPGVYEYAFVSPAGDWYVPDSVAGRKDDGMGGEVAQLVVEGVER